MPKLTEAAILKRDAKRDLAAELRESAVAKARIAMNLSQSQFADLLGVSVRTLQHWEQGRREPTGAARTLIKVAIYEPKALRKAVAA